MSDRMAKVREGHGREGPTEVRAGELQAEGKASARPLRRPVPAGRLTGQGGQDPCPRGFCLRPLWAEAKPGMEEVSCYM